MKVRKAERRLQRRIKNWVATMNRIGLAKQAAYKCPGSRKR